MKHTHARTFLPHTHTHTHTHTLSLCRICRGKRKNKREDDSPTPTHTRSLPLLTPLHSRTHAQAVLDRLIAASASAEPGNHLHYLAPLIHNTSKLLEGRSVVRFALPFFPEHTVN